MKSVTFEFLSGPYVQCFCYVGILPFQGEDFSSSKTRSLRAMAHTSITILQLMYLTTVITDFDEVKTNASFWIEFLAMFFVNLSFCIIVSKGKEFLKVLYLGKKLWKQLQEEEFSNVMFYERKLRVMYLIFLFGCLVTASIFSIAAMYSNSLDGMQARHFPLQCLYSVQNSPWFEIIFGIQAIGSLVLSITVSGYIIGLPIFNILLTCGLLRTVNTRLAAFEKTVIIGNMSESELKKRLVSIIKFHNEILRLLRHVKNIAESLFLCQIPNVMIMVTIALLQLVTSKSERNKFIALFPLSLVEAFTFNFVSELLTEESKQLSDTISMAHLITSNREINKIVMIFHSRVQKFLHIKAGGIFVLSMEYFGLLISRCYRAFNVLRNSTPK